jgi:regulator of protease activity HflC (stomatin/prohibitin superfamily)
MKADTSSPPAAKPRSRWSRFAERRLPNVVMWLMVAAFVVAVLYPFMVITVPSGYVGVLWKRFGGLGIYCWCLVGRGTALHPSEIRGEGLHVIWPWDRLFLYDLRLQSTTQTYNAISKDGVSLTAAINARFQLRHDSVAQLHKFIGPGYMELVVSPEIGSRARDVISQYPAEQVYSTARGEIEDSIRQSVQAKLAARLDSLVQIEASDQFQSQSLKPVAPDLRSAINLLDTLVLGIQLPDQIMSAINNKVQQLYIAQEYDFRIERERKESERKRIEAAGVRDFQETVSQGISDSYLRWRDIDATMHGIDATLTLAQSPNSKVVVIGNARNGLPIILGSDAAFPPAGAPPIPSKAGGAQALWPAAPSEKALGADLPAPPDNKPVTGSGSPLPAPAQPKSVIPLTWFDLQSILSRLYGPAEGTETNAPANDARQRPAPAPQQ